jgi:hypothetical protein
VHSTPLVEISGELGITTGLHRTSNVRVFDSPSAS